MLSRHSIFSGGIGGLLLAIYLTVQSRVAISISFTTAVVFILLVPASKLQAEHCVWQRSDNVIGGGLPGVLISCDGKLQPGGEAHDVTAECDCAMASFSVCGDVRKQVQLGSRL